MLNLESKIAELRKDIKTEKLSMSIGEIQGIYKNNELNIQPKFQRILRWSEEQKTGLIESLLLGIPIPPIFVAQDQEGRWDVVDGVQRLGSILEFLGDLKDQNGVLRAPLVLRGTRLLAELDRATYKDSGIGIAFSSSLRLDFKRTRLDVEIIQRESDATARYELFERLNTGGSSASDQEVRNCVLVWLNEDLFDWMKDLTENSAFSDCIQLPERLEAQGYRFELVLRFLALRSMSDGELRGIRDLGEFLNEKNREIAKDPDFPRAAHRRTFVRTFEILGLLGADCFRKYDKVSRLFRGPFLISAFEAVACGVAANLPEWRKLDPARRTAALRSKVQSMWSDGAFTGRIGIGVPARDRIPHSVGYGRAHFAP